VLILQKRKEDIQLIIGVLFVFSLQEKGLRGFIPVSKLCDCGLD